MAENDDLIGRRGRIKHINIPGGFGFLTDAEGTDRFFHISQLRGKDINKVRAGEIVTFVIAEDRGRGPRASNVWTLDKRVHGDEAQ